MDYCSSCRRNLNGALMCPGCGAYAPDIAPPGFRSDAPSDATTAPWEAQHAQEATATAPHHDPFGFDFAPVGVSAVPADATADTADAPAFADGSSADGFTTPSPTGQGRAARRRQLARWKKHRRRAAAAATFAIAGGALTASLLPGKPSAGHTQAAAASPDPERTVADSMPERPDSRASRHSDTRKPTSDDRAQHTDVATTSPATTSRPSTAATGHPQADPSTAPHTASTMSKKTHTASARPEATPTTSAPAASEPSDTSTPSGGQDTTQPAPSSPSTTSPSTTEPTSPAHLCLLGLVCVE
ncbi:hypothetical protein QOM21_04335 [Streptomyces sp. Pv4-95]|uniref:SCO2400 family protein n=1 Tax=Streptomyces sp. Pv4-95 TaxID=3049543 RepID=UPI003891C613